MVLWRISRHVDLNGTGGLRAPGRWHWQGHPVVYLASSPAGALLEVCVHTSANNVPQDFTLLRVVVNSLQPASLGERLPADWIVNLGATRSVGTEWLRSRESALLEVPSSIVPETANFLLNPLHADAGRLTISGVYPYPFDARLKR